MVIFLVGKGMLLHFFVRVDPPQIPQDHHQISAESVPKDTFKSLFVTFSTQGRI